MISSLIKKIPITGSEKELLRTEPYGSQDKSKKLSSPLEERWCPLKLYGKQNIFPVDKFNKI